MKGSLLSRIVGRQRLPFSSAVRPRVELGRVSPQRTVPDSIDPPPYAKTGVVPESPSRIIVHDSEGIKRMREAGALTRDVLNYAESLIEVGRQTDEIDRLVHEYVIKRGAYPSPLNYSGYPKSICTSINEVICHGIPDSRQLQDGDIMNIDVSVFIKGYHGDTSRTFLVGNVDEDGKRLVTASKEAMDSAIAICGPGVPWRSIGSKIEDVCDAYGYQSNRTFCGHGIGRDFHMLPYIYHYRNSHPGEMRPGMTFTIEPMLCEGSAKHIILEDEWTAVTIDGKRSAQFEHTVLVTEDGVEILT